MNAAIAPSRSKPTAAPAEPLRVVFVTNFASHYRVRTFETLARHFRVRYLFFSGGTEWYWQKRHGTRTGNFDHRYLAGASLAGTRIVPALIPALLAGGYDVMVKCINGRFALPVSYLCARLLGRPFVLWTGVWSKLTTRFHRATAFLTNYLYRHADAIVVYGEHVKRYLISVGVEPRRIFVAAHAVDNAAYAGAVAADAVAALRARLGLAGDERVVLYLGRIEREKGLEYLIEAFARLRTPGARLLLAGTGSQQGRLQARARELGIADRVRFGGYVRVEDARTYYAAAELLVLPSVTVPTGKEPWGLVVNEAFNQAVPAVATDAVGAAAGGLVRDGVNGLVVPERNSAALAGAIDRILGDADLRARLSRAALEAVADWDNERMVRGFREAIEFAYRTRHQALACRVEEPGSAAPREAR